MDSSLLANILDEVSKYCLNSPLFEIVDEKKCDFNSRVIGKKGKFYPKRIQVELTNACNFSCFHCYKSANKDNGIFIEDKMFYNLLDFAGPHLTTLAFTGGEPLLHPHFEQYVIRAKKMGLKLELNTNGSLLSKINKEILYLFDRIAITLYGTSCLDYENNCYNAYGFEQLKESCRWLNKNNISFFINIVVSEEVLSKLEEYIKTAIVLKPIKVKIGTISKIGKAINIKNSNYGYNPDYDRKVYREIRKLQNKYSSKLEIEDWERIIFHAKEIDEALYSKCCLACNAGNLNWAMNELGKMKPCVMLPQEDEFVWSFEQWKKYVDGESNIMWEGYMEKYIRMCEKKKIRPEDYCESLSLVYYKAK